jgi:hypothetical protein
VSNQKRATAMRPNVPSGMVCFVCASIAKVQVQEYPNEPTPMLAMAVTMSPIMVPTQDGMEVFVLPVCMEHLPAGTDRPHIQGYAGSVR